MLRRAAVAGTWYPGEQTALRATVESLLSEAGVPALYQRLVGLVSPHAGLRYSGKVAAHAYALLARRPPSTVVLVGPSHREWFEGCRLIRKGAFETPLGAVAIDEALASQILAAERTILDDERPHREEHSLEMQLPFVRVAAPRAQIVPILMGAQTAETMRSLGRALQTALRGTEAVVVASSDLSHYHPAEAAHALDASVIADVEAFDAAALEQRLERESGHACGGGPMVAVMLAARGLGATESHVLRYADSGDEGERDKSRVVGYLAAAFTAPA
jgi:MEMO1 family protein